MTWHFPVSGSSWLVERCELARALTIRWASSFLFRQRDNTEPPEWADGSFFGFVGTRPMTEDPRSWEITHVHHKNVTNKSLRADGSVINAADDSGTRWRWIRSIFSRHSRIVQLHRTMPVLCITWHHISLLRYGPITRPPASDISLLSPLNLTWSIRWAASSHRNVASDHHSDVSVPDFNFHCSCRYFAHLCTSAVALKKNAICLQPLRDRVLSLKTNSSCSSIC